MFPERERERGRERAGQDAVTGVGQYLRGPNKSRGVRGFVARRCPLFREPL